MAHNCRDIMEKLYRRLMTKEGCENLLKELDRMDQGKQGLTEEKVSAICEDVAQFFPDEYKSVPEAASLVAKVKADKEKKAKEQ